MSDQRSILDTIGCPSDLKKLSREELEQLAAEIRRRLIATVSRTGGHLAPNLGVVELTLGIYRALDCPGDVVTFDVGHQSYVHKLITGRCDCFDSLRCYQGISGFPNRNESEYDLFGSGHASDSVSISLGYALARDARGGNEEVVCMIGDGSMTGGMAWEALNHLGHLGTRMIVVLNDNEMSISKNVGALASYLGRARLDKRYTKSRDTFQAKLEQSKIGYTIAQAGKTLKESIKTLVVPGMLFEELGLSYVGPIDGHDLEQVESAIRAARNTDGPVVIHAVTQKGRGFDPAIQDPTAFHGIAPFDPESGEVDKTAGAPLAYTKIFSQAIVTEAERDERIVAITAAMAPGTGLDAFAQRFPDRFFDVGIAEEHAVGLAAGLAFGGKIPVCAIYSTFLQRAYDQIIGDVALQGAHVVFAIDRGGFVGDDGPTHHGVFDLSYLRTIPTMQILAPSNEAELVNALHTAINLDGPVAVRYPRGAALGVAVPDEPKMLPYGRGVVLSEDATSDVALIAVGRMVENAREAASLLRAQSIGCTVVDARWVKPLDSELITSLSRTHKLVVTVEENTIRGGFGAGVLEELSVTNPLAQVLIMGVPDEFAKHGSMEQLIVDAKLDSTSIAERIIQRLGTNVAR